MRARGAFLLGFRPKIKNEWNKWKNHSYEMKEDVGMSLHEKERNKKMPTPRHKATHNPIPTSLFLPRPQHTFSCVQMLCCLLCLTNKQTNKQHVKAKQKCNDGVMSGFVSCVGIFLFLSFSSLHPPSFHRIDFSTCNKCAGEYSSYILKM